MPKDLGPGGKLYDAMEQSVIRSESTRTLPENVNETLVRSARRLGCSLLRTLTSLAEVGATTACHWLLTGDSAYSSHEFASISIYSAINEQLGRPITTALHTSPDHTTIDEYDAQQDGLYELVEDESLSDFIDDIDDPVQHLSTLMRDIDDDCFGTGMPNDGPSSYSSTDSTSHVVADVYTSRLVHPDHLWTREFKTIWSNGDETWEPRDCFVSDTDGTINRSLIVFERSRTLEEYGVALQDTLDINYAYDPTTPHQVVLQPGGWQTITTKNNDTLTKIAGLFPLDSTITPDTLLETNVWYHSAVNSDTDRYHVGEPVHGLTLQSKLRDKTVLRLPRVVHNHVLPSTVNNPSSTFTAQVPLHIDYRHRSCSKCSETTKKKIKDLSLYEAVSLYHRVRGQPSDKALMLCTSIAFTKQHPLHATHFWRLHPRPVVPLLWGPRMPDFRKASCYTNV
jgi:hypothetical protein